MVVAYDDVATNITVDKKAALFMTGKPYCNSHASASEFVRTKQKQFVPQKSRKSGQAQIIFSVNADEPTSEWADDLLAVRAPVLNRLRRTVPLRMKHGLVD